MEITLEQAAEQLRGGNHITILCHRKPDGDTTGSALALYDALTELGKKVRIRCSDPLPELFQFLEENYREPEEFEEDFVVAVDVASVPLLGDLQEEYGEKVDLCIDHHSSNSRYARQLYLDGGAAAAAELIYRLFKAMEVPLTVHPALCIYTGLATDTGCFCFSNTTPASLRIAAEVLELGAPVADANRRLFESKKPSRVALEAQVLGSLEYYYEGHCAVMLISQELKKRFGVNDDELEGLSSIPRKIEGVWVGVTIREQEDCCRISLRTTPEADACAICAAFGGGGHIRAAGCTIEGGPDRARELLLREIGRQAFPGKQPEMDE